MTEQNKKPDDAIQDELDEIEDEIIRDKIREVFRDNPNNPMEALEEIGFTWHDDAYPSEEEEENAAVPENKNQKNFVSFLQSDKEPPEDILKIFLAEKASKTPNFPLFRKYFRKAAPQTESPHPLGIG